MLEIIIIRNGMAILKIKYSSLKYTSPNRLLIAHVVVF